MSILISLGIIILAMLILASMKLNSGVFALFYHYALGKYPKNKASFLSTFFILGVEVISVFLFLSIFYLSNFLFFFTNELENKLFSSILAGIFFLLSLASLFCYFRRGSGTRLFISANFSKALNENAKSAKSRSDAFLLGAFSGISELIFTFPLYLAFSYELIRLNLHAFSNLPLILAFILIPIIPLAIVRFLYSAGYNLADYLRLRFKNKNFTRFSLFICYFTIALLIIYRVSL